MRYASFVIAIATLAVAGCADPYYPSSQSSYGYGSGSYPAGSGYYPTRYGYGSTGDYRTYSAGPQVTITLP